jgi:putative hemolysin
MVIAVTFVSIIACKGGTAGQSNSGLEGNYYGEKQSKSQIEENNPKTALANPAAGRCINDGYVLEPIVENGVSVDYLCVNSKTGLKCEIWKYFRNECTLVP